MTDDSTDTDTKDSVIADREWRVNEPEEYSAVVGRSFNSRAVMQGPNTILGGSIAIPLPTDAFPQAGEHEP